MADREQQPTPPECCGEWHQARRPGSDNELYGAAISLFQAECFIGDISKPVHWCPWCGAAKTKPKDATDA